VACPRTGKLNTDNVNAKPIAEQNALIIKNLVPLVRTAGNRDTDRTKSARLLRDLRGDEIYHDSPMIPESFVLPGIV
jgi:hypothetical protein